MFILATPKKLRKHLRSKIKTTNQKKLKIDRLSLKESLEEMKQC